MLIRFLVLVSLIAFIPSPMAWANEPTPAPRGAGPAPAGGNPPPAGDADDSIIDFEPDVDDPLGGSGKVAKSLADIHKEYNEQADNYFNDAHEDIHKDRTTADNTDGYRRLRDLKRRVDEKIDIVEGQYDDWVKSVIDSDEDVKKAVDDIEETDRVKRNEKIVEILRDALDGKIGHLSDADKELLRKTLQALKWIGWLWNTHDRLKEAMELLDDTSAPYRRQRVGSLPRQPDDNGQQYARHVAIQERNVCVSTTYTVWDEIGLLMANYPGGDTDQEPQGGGGSSPGESARSTPETPPTPKANTPPHTDGKDNFFGTSGPDEFTGGPGEDEFTFMTKGKGVRDQNPETLGQGDRIRDYESGEVIMLFGARVRPKDIKLTYDPTKNETRLDIDIDEDGKPDRTLILDGDKRGKVSADPNCCAQSATRIQIKLSDEAPKSAEDGQPGGGTKPETPAGGDKTGGDKKAEGGDVTPKVNKPPHTDGDDSFDGTKGPDEFTGGRGKDTYFFDDDRGALDDGDRITDYESGEEILVKGFRIGQVEVKYDEKKDETRIEIDTDGDGRTDKAIILNGDKRGKLQTARNCCGSRMTTIQIDTTKKPTGTAEQTQPPAPETPKEPEQKEEVPPSDLDIAQGRQGENDLGLVKATREVLLVLKDGNTGKPVEDFAWKLVDEDPELPVASNDATPTDGTPATTPANDPAYADDVTGGSSGNDGSLIVSYNNASPRDRPVSTGNDGNGKPRVYEILTGRQARNHLILAMDGVPRRSETLGSARTVPPALTRLGFDLDVTSGYRIGDLRFLVVELPADQVPAFTERVSQLTGFQYVEPDFCRNKKQLNDPYFNGRGAWGQDFDDQWAIKRTGLTDGPDGAWALLGDKPAEVTVAVVDTGIDWNHPDLGSRTLWRNLDEVPDNGIDDDGNGYVDDVIGWDFVDGDNRPWDHDGHGTFTSGLIAAAHNNGTGIAGINPHARIMMLRALDAFGQGHASMISAAIAYAADNGARVINLSLGGEGLTKTEQLAVDYARRKGVVVVVAAGNEGSEVAGSAPGGLEGVITVSSTDRQDRRVGFSNYGPGIGVAAPGIEVLSLRGRNTDLLAYIRDVDYQVGKGIVGEDRAYFRASGTSFSAPIVTGIASLVLSKNPKLTGEQVSRMVLQSARDIETPGIDNFSGYGIVDAVAALKADPDFFVDSRIASVRAVKGKSGPALQLLGTVDAEKFAGAEIELGQGESPDGWKSAAPKLTKPVKGGVLGEIPAKLFKGAKKWTVRVIARHKNGATRESRYTITLG